MPERLSRNLEDLLGTAALQAVGVMQTLLLLVLLLAEGPALVRAARQVLPQAWRATADGVGRSVQVVVGRYAVGSLLLALLAGTGWSPSASSRPAWRTSPGCLRPWCWACGWRGGGCCRCSAWSWGTPRSPCCWSDRPVAVAVGALLTVAVAESVAWVFLWSAAWEADLHVPMAFVSALAFLGGFELGGVTGAVVAVVRGHLAVGVLQGAAARADEGPVEGPVERDDAGAPGEGSMTVAPAAARAVPAGSVPGG